MFGVLAKERVPSMPDRLQQLVEAVSEAELRELCADALRTWHRGANRYYFDVFGDFAPPLIDALSARAGRQPIDQRLHHDLSTSLHLPWMAPVLDFLWWMVRAGLAVPFADTNDRMASHFHITRAGKRFIEAGADHPLLPASLDRLRARCTGLPDDVVALLLDARVCYEHGLHRPAVVLVGVAYESVVEDLAEALAAANHLTGPIPPQAARRLASVKGALGRRFPGNTGSMIEARTAAEQACDFADHLRRRRNDGSHTTPRFGVDDHAEVEELMVSATRHLPSLWAAR